MATVIYADASAASNGSGTQANPYYSFHAAYQAASAGDVIDLTGTFDWTDAKESGDIKDAGYKISKNLTIRGQGPGNTYIQAASSKGAADRRIFQIANNVSVTFKDLTLRYGEAHHHPNNYVEYPGAAIGSGDPVNYGNYKGVDITLKNVNVAHNQGGDNFDDASTAAIYVEGSISATNCTFEGNKIYGSKLGDVIKLYQNTNYPKREFINCTFHDNKAGSSGSVLDLYGSGTNIVNCTFTDNKAGRATIDMGCNYSSQEEIFIYNTVVANTILNSGGSNMGYDVHNNGCSSGDIKAKYSVIEDLNDPNNNVTSTNLTTGNQSQLYLANSTTTNGNNNFTPFLKYTSNTSILLDAGNSSSSVGNTYSGGTVSTPSTDQRGFSNEASTDIGSYEKVLFQPDQNLNALEFYGRGSDEYVKVKDDPSLDVSSITVEAWVKLNCSNNSSGCGNDANGRIAIKPDGSGSGGVLNTSDYVSNSVFFLGFDGSGKTPRFAIQTSSGVTDFTATNALNKSEWYHVAGTYNSSTGKAKIYVNGKVVASKNLIVNNMVTSSEFLTIGASKSSSKNKTTYGLDGNLDEIRIWSEARTASEIRQHMARTLKGDNANLEAYYRFNQTSGTSAPDLSNNTNDGTLKNMTTSGSGNDWVGSNAFTTWQGDESSNWSTSGNWTDGVPSSGDNVGIVSNSNFNEPSVSGSPTVDNLTIGPNASPTVNSDITVNNHLMLENKLDMAGNTLTLTDGSNVFPEGGASGQYISGTVKKKGNDAFTFPLGDGGKWARLKISASRNSGDAYTASYTNSGSSKSGTGSNLHSVSDVEHWDLSYNNNVASPSRDVTLYWEDASFSGISNLNDLVIAHWNTSNTEWESLGQSTTSGNTSSNGSITVKSVSNFSPFTFGSNSNNNSLPVELLHFTAQKNGDHVDLKWATASETNNRHFVVQKRIDDQWQAIGTVEGHGTATSKHSYKFADREYQQGNTAYYRLKQVDFDGSYDYSEVRAVSSELVEAFRLTTYPNPVRDRLILTLNAVQPEKVTVVIRNALGQQVLSRRISLQKGKNREALNLNSLKSGPYFLSVKTTEQVFHKKFVKE